MDYLSKVQKTSSPPKNTFWNLHELIDIIGAYYPISKFQNLNMFYFTLKVKLQFDKNRQQTFSVLGSNSMMDYL